jgi:hypothetical protein
MARSIEQVISAFGALGPEDFINPEDGLGKVYSLTEELRALPQPERAIPAMFDVLARLSDVDLGSPGPLVHTLEQMRGHYENSLAESIRHKPTALTVWMLNRILNGIPSFEEKRVYVELLRSAAGHPAASEVAKVQAARFVQRHTQGA